MTYQPDSCTILQQIWKKQKILVLFYAETPEYFTRAESGKILAGIEFQRLYTSFLLGRIFNNEFAVPVNG